MSGQRTIQEQIGALSASLADKLGLAGQDDPAFAALRPLLDQDAELRFLGIVESFLSLDQSLSRTLLASAPAALGIIHDQAARAAFLRVAADMGRSKWSVMERLFRELPALKGRADAVILGWGSSAARLADKDQDVALEFVKATGAMLMALDDEAFGAWSKNGVEITLKAWKAGREYFRSSAEVIKKIDVCDLDRWAKLGLLLIDKAPDISASYSAHSLLAVGAAAGKAKKAELALQYFKSAPQILGRLTVHDLEEWVSRGLQNVESQADKGKSFFSLQTGSSRTTMESLVKGLELRDIHTVLRDYAQALIGAKIMLRSSSIFYKNLPGLSRFFSVTDGWRIFVPSRIEVFADEEMNFKTYKWVLTHELAHILHGTFDIGASTIRDELAALPDPRQAFRIFEFLEDERVDHLMMNAYPGLSRDRDAILSAFLAREREKGITQHPFLEQIGLRGIGGLTEGVDRPGLSHLVEQALDRVLRPGATSRDALNAAVEIGRTLEGGNSCNLSESKDAGHRLFYRGVIDYDLVENSRVGTVRLVADLVDRFSDRKQPVEAPLVEIALRRIEQETFIDSEELLWQIQEPARLTELFDQVKAVLEEMEAEKRFRRTVYYDEWDSKIGDYRKDWVRVREMDTPESSSAFYDRTVSEQYGLVSILRRYFGLLRPDRIQRFFREERGDDIDFDAMIESVVERHAGVTPSDRVYIRREKNLRDVSVAFLVDMSYSTGDELPSGKRIIDVEREGLVLMAEALESIGDQWAVYGFSSNYRDKMDFYVIRDFDERSPVRFQQRFDYIKPMAQTRLGAAIRHATKLLARQGSRIRLLILLSDGRPYDVDYGDADYAVEDTRHALWEAKKKGVFSFCITVDKKSRDYLPYMYGETNYTLIDNVETLPIRLPLIYKRLTT
ncbi:MAG TPA: VWA domain-containing protein [Nitrospirota bacterium]|nr:VWA domain-containing protein [Nitrospirota bacterium]